MMGKRTWITEHSDIASASKHTDGEKKHCRMAFGITARAKTQSFALTCWHSLYSPTEPGTCHRDIVWSPPAWPGCPWAVPGLSPCVGPQCPLQCPLQCPVQSPLQPWLRLRGAPEHRTQINVLPVSLREAWTQETLQERIHGKFNILKINSKAFQVEESRGFLFHLWCFCFRSWH